MKKIYIAGCAGMLWEAFFDVFSKNYELKCTDIDLNEEWISHLDFRDYKSYLDDVVKFNPNYLFHLGAFTNLEYCEKNIDQTYITNTLSAENAVWISNKLNIPLVFISTAGIFDGSQDTYNDWDMPNPLGHYAKSKYYAEKFVQNNSRNYFIFRAGWMMGGGPKKDKKFINKIIHQIKNNALELNVVDDKFGTPTYTHDFAKNVELVLNSESWGLYNLVCNGVTSRYDVAIEILKLLNLEKKIKVNKVDSNFFKSEYFAERPYSERLINMKLKLRSLDIMRDWKICLDEYLKKDYSNYV